MQLETPSLPWNSLSHYRAPHESSPEESKFLRLNSYFPIAFSAFPILSAVLFGTLCLVFWLFHCPELPSPSSPGPLLAVRWRAGSSGCRRLRCKARSTAAAHPQHNDAGGGGGGWLLVGRGRGTAGRRAAGGKTSLGAAGTEGGQPGASNPSFKQDVGCATVIYSFHLFYVSWFVGKKCNLLLSLGQNPKAFFFFTAPTFLHQYYKAVSEQASPSSSAFTSPVILSPQPWHAPRTPKQCWCSNSAVPTQGIKLCQLSYCEHFSLSLSLLKT